MALWLFIECGWCGYRGCSAPIGDRCPSCQHALDPEPVRTPPDPSTPPSSEEAA